MLMFEILSVTTAPTRVVSEIYTVAAVMEPSTANNSPVVIRRRIIFLSFAQIIPILAHDPAKGRFEFGQHLQQQPPHPAPSFNHQLHLKAVSLIGWCPTVLAQTHRWRLRQRHVRLKTLTVGLARITWLVHVRVFGAILGRA